MREKAITDASKCRLDAVAQSIARGAPSLAPPHASVPVRKSGGWRTCEPKRLAWISSHSAAKSANASAFKHATQICLDVGGSREAGVVTN